MGSAHSPSQMYGKAALALARSFTLLLFILGLSSPHARAEFLRSADFQAGGSLDLYYAYNFNTPPPVEAPTDTDLSAPPGQNAYRIFVAMPSKKRKDGQFKDIAHPLNQETRNEIEQSVFAAYEKEIRSMGENLSEIRREGSADEY